MIDYNKLAKEIHVGNYQWWHDVDGNRIDRNHGELLMLTVTEVSEACEGIRKNLMDDHLPHRKMVEVELADTMIRILDYAGGFGFEIEEHDTHQSKFDDTENEAECLLIIVDEILSVYNKCGRESEDIRFVINTINAHADRFGYDVFGAMAEKREYNKQRADHKIENRLAEGGKKI